MKQSKASVLWAQIPRPAVMDRVVFDRLKLWQCLLGFGLAVFIAGLLVGFDFHSIPHYNVGDIADRTIESPLDFTVEDVEATIQKHQEIIETVPAVFDLNLRINSRIEFDLRTAFGNARRIIAEEIQSLGLPPGTALPREAHDRVLTKLEQQLPRFDDRQELQICLRHSFSPLLENQLVKLLHEAMKDPGVISSRSLLLHHQHRGILLRNTVTGKEQHLTDWMAIRDLAQARDALRQNEFELTAVSGQDKSRLIAFLDDWVVPNVDFNLAATEFLEEEAKREAGPVVIQIKRGRTIVRAGDEITTRQQAQLEQLRNLVQSRGALGRFAGVLLIVLFFVYALWHYLVTHPNRHKSLVSQYLLAAVVLIIALAISRGVIYLGDMVAGNLAAEVLKNPNHFYLLAPLALGAVLLILLADVQLAILVSLMVAVFAALLTNGLSLAVYTLAGSFSAIYALDQYRERSAIIRAGLVIGCVNLFIALALQLYASSGPFLWTVFFVRSGAALLSGFFAAMLASLLLPILESLFKITTDIKLLELSNLNKPILRRLAVEAPGTYHHSIIVGTLAEAGAEAIGANALLVRVGAYYHDIGKLKKPEYYVENQIYCANKHESLSPSMSSLILASHVKDGMALADEIKLVPLVRDLIPQHHGTRLMTYFYQKAKDAASDKHREVNEDDFRYPGPKPQTKEAAILMLSDQVEAAARTLQDPTSGQIRSLIHRLIQSTIQDGQLDECDITLKELYKIAGAFERVITGMYHHRIEYPGFEFSKQIEGKRPESQRIQ